MNTKMTRQKNDGTVEFCVTLETVPVECDCKINILLLNPNQPKENMNTINLITR